MMNELLNNRCTDICTTLAKLTLVNGKLPNHDELLSWLPIKQEVHQEDAFQDGFLLGTLTELRDRKSCPFCQLVS
jgi:hypothetical protein